MDALAIDEGYRGDFRRVTTLAEIQAALGAGEPVVVGFKVTDNLFAYKSGIISSVSDQSVGLSAIVLVAYDPASDSFKFANAWGTQWGESGFGRISSSAAASSFDLTNAWSVRSVIKASE